MGGPNEKDELVKVCVYENTQYQLIAEHGSTCILKPLARKRVDTGEEDEGVLFVDISEISDIKKVVVNHVGIESLDNDFLYKMLFNFCKVVGSRYDLVNELMRASRSLKVPMPNADFDINIMLSITPKNQEENE